MICDYCDEGNVAIEGWHSFVGESELDQPYRAPCSVSPPVQVPGQSVPTPADEACRNCRGSGIDFDEGSFSSCKDCSATGVSRREWRLNGELHRDGGPAIEWADGTKYWYQHGERHRDGGPAVEYADGSKYWYQHGELHRDDGPAIEYPDVKEWWIDGVRQEVPRA